MISLDLFQLSGTVETGNIIEPTAPIQLLTPYVSVIKGTPPTHAFDSRNGGPLGCYADHFAPPSPAPPADANAGTVTISGYAGGKIESSSGSMTTAPSTINCAVVSGNYACGYGPLSGGAPADSADAQPYASGMNPLGSGTIHFSNVANSEIGTFDVTGSASGTLSVTESLTSLTFTAGTPVTLNYSCSGSSSASPLIIVSLAATQNGVTSVSNPSPTFGAVTCAAVGGSSITIPGAAITAMLDGDTKLKSVLTSAICAVPPETPPQDTEGNPVNVIVGQGTFGISSL